MMTKTNNDDEREKNKHQRNGLSVVIIIVVVRAFLYCQLPAALLSMFDVHMSKKEHNLHASKEIEVQQLQQHVKQQQLHNFDVNTVNKLIYRINQCKGVD